MINETMLKHDYYKEIHSIRFYRIVQEVYTGQETRRLRLPKYAMSQNCHYDPDAADSRHDLGEAHRSGSTSSLQTILVET